ncbi:unnamed protein product [Linum tenue]|uniref:TIR domain-containing protein n=1 Tax=Linum tenue TaxID=586396 RepID=A0AAV0K7I4_9ROSI|nr:unnamed protein product [Linum tenue]
MNFIRGTVMAIVLLLQPIVLLFKLLFGRRAQDAPQQLQAINHSAIVPATVVADSEDGIKNSNNISQQSDATGSASSPSAPPAGSNSGDDDSISLPLPFAEYEVFLSFRGPDTRHQFTDILYRFLVRLKIRTFRDDDELRTGEGIWPNLVKAIGQSKIHVPVMSETYAHSKWCLMELSEMAKRRKQEKGHIILPIFYMTNPRDVRHQTGPYQSAFQQHDKDFDSGTVQEWRAALNEIGALKGWHVKSKDEQGAVSECVSDVVWSHLSKNDNFSDTDELVGIDDSVEAVVEKLSLDVGGAAMVGLHGLGGIGKTTIARAVYNKISARFDRRSFLENIRETQQQKDGGISLQKKLISNSMRIDYVAPINSVEEGRRIIQDRVSQFKVLIILDDVDESFKFEEILGNSGNFACGSRFIITSRNMKLLSTFNESRCKLYEVREMGPQLSLQLFCKYAFKTDSPPQDFTTLSEKIVTTAAGLPLTLKVVGSLLFREEKSIWEDKLSMLEKAPQKEVKERLKISYDALEYETKQIFLDVACFFIGMEMKIASYYWRDCKFHPVNSINILLQRSMLKIGDDNEFQMHDQMRDMGRAIVCEENIEEPWMRSRVWDDKEGTELLLNKKGSKQVKAVRADYHRSFLGGMKPGQFQNLPELRYFEAEFAEFSGDFNNLVPNLKWLRLHFHYNDGQEPTNFDMSNLVILDLKGSIFLTDDWGGWSQIKMAKKLKVLDLSHCTSLIKLPDFPKSGSLEMLNLSAETSMELDIGNLWNLKVLNLKECALKRVTGGTIGMLKCLEELDLTNLQCNNWKQRVVDIGELPSLKVLKTIGVKHIPSYFESNTDDDEEEDDDDEVESEGEGIEKLPPSLKVLHTSFRVANLSELLELEELVVENCDFGLEIPPVGDDTNANSTAHMWWKVSKLKSLTLHKTKFIVVAGTAPSFDQLRLPSSLTTLNISNCPYLEWIPTLENLNNLTELTITKCSKVLEVRGIQGLTSLQSLVIDDRDDLIHLCGLADLMRLKTFEIKESAPLSREALLLNDDSDDVFTPKIILYHIDELQGN